MFIAVKITPEALVDSNNGDSPRLLSAYYDPGSILRILQARTS